ncbi:MAG: hypothetical protein KFF49_09140 [Bacteroidales bacterium]|nr:hypothetical protein [Bacteroidales bacterium]
MKNLILLLNILLITSLIQAARPVKKVCLFAPGSSLTFNACQDTSMMNQLYYNGRVWYGKYFNVYGTEFLLEDKWYKADVSINGINFNGVEVKYDIYNDELLTNYHRRKIIILNNENIDSFTLYTGNKELYFENLSGKYDLEGHYQVIYEGKSKLYKKWRKKRAQFVVEARFDEFQSDDALIVLSGGETHRLKKRRHLLRLMNDKKDEVRSYIRHENIRIDFANPESLVPVLEYYDTL